MRILFSALFFLVFVPAIAQKAVVLQHNGVATIFSTTNPLVDAYTASVSGDTIYVPGGNYPGLTIDHKLVLIGAGHYPDSTAVTGVTTISSINLLQGSDKTQLQGFYVINGISFEYNKKIDSVIIYRCFAAAISVTGENRPEDNCTGLLFYQNVIASMSIPHSSGIRVFNNIMSVVVNNGTNSWLRNNKLNALVAFNYGLVENNTITGFGGGVDFNTYRNNIFPFAQLADNSTWVGNYYSVGFENLFLKSTEWFNYSDDYHLINPASFTSSDGTPIGIYGGFYPYKEGAVPSTPHLQSKTIPLQADVSGQLNIQVKVAAQNN